VDTTRHQKPNRLNFAMTMSSSVGQRAGFWRRFFSRTIDFGGNLETMSVNNFFGLIALALLPTVVWAIIFVVQVANGHDPLYDRVAGTAVVRV
jgi:hypothetical protein